MILFVIMVLRIEIVIGSDPASRLTPRHWLMISSRRIDIFSASLKEELMIFNTYGSILLEAVEMFRGGF